MIDPSKPIQHFEGFYAVPPRESNKLTLYALHKLGSMLKGRGIDAINVG